MVDNSFSQSVICMVTPVGPLHRVAGTVPGYTIQLHVHYAESHGVHIKFTHVHSHQGHGLNELADNMAKAGADFLHCSGVPFHLHQDWYKQGSGTTEWAWLMHLSPWTKTQYGFPIRRRKRSALPHGQDAVHAHLGRRHCSRKAGNVNRNGH